MSYLIDHPLPLYATKYGQAYVGDSLELMEKLPRESISLLMTSPPFALLRKKEYGNEAQDMYVDWLTRFGAKVKEILRPDGSFVLDLGGAYQRGKPARSIYNFEVLIRFVKELGFILAEDFYWFNPAKLPSPIEWVNKRKIRVKDAVNTVWWFAKTDFPKANIENVLVPYSDRMKKLLDNPEAFYKKGRRPSGHEISRGFDKGKPGAIPPNLLSFANTDSNSLYMRMCKNAATKRHPARFPLKLPEFFIKFLTDPGDVVLDIFAGSNTTGEAAERLGRQWLAFELNQEYLAASSFRFLNGIEQKNPKRILQLLMQSETGNYQMGSLRPEHGLETFMSE